MDHEYAFDIRLIAAIRVRASTPQEARGRIKELLDCADTNFGCWPDGSPATAEVSLDETQCPHLYLIDGEEPT